MSKTNVNFSPKSGIGENIIFVPVAVAAGAKIICVIRAIVRHILK